MEDKSHHKKPEKYLKKKKSVKVQELKRTWAWGELIAKIMASGTSEWPHLLSHLCSNPTMNFRKICKNQDYKDSWAT